MLISKVTMYSHHRDHHSGFPDYTWSLVRVLHHKAAKADHVLYFWKSRWPIQAKYHRVLTQSVYCIVQFQLSFLRQGGGGPVETDQVQHHWKGASSKNLFLNFAVHLE